MKIRLLILLISVSLLSGCASLRPRPQELIPQAEAEQLALKHAGFSEDEVTGLRSEAELDERFPVYEVEFYRRQWKYDYVIHAASGEVLSFEKEM